MEVASASLMCTMRAQYVCSSCRRVLAIPRRTLHQTTKCSRVSSIRQLQLSIARPLSSSSIQSDDLNRDSQAHPLGDFYAELLAKPIPKASKAKTELPTFVDTGGDATKQERAARLFGTIKGSGYERTVSQTPDATWRTINGVPIPPRPGEPDNCCMSGCAHCVWDDYREDVESWAARLHEAQAKGLGTSDKITPKIEMSRSEVSAASTSMDDDGGGSESLWTSPSADDDSLFTGIPVGIREFMATEKRIKDRKKKKS